MTTGTQTARKIANEQFAVQKLNPEGRARVHAIRAAFDLLLEEIRVEAPAGRELSLVQTHLEEACFYAVKAMSKQPHNQEE